MCQLSHSILVESGEFPKIRYIGLQPVAKVQRVARIGLAKQGRGALYFHHGLQEVQKPFSRRLPTSEVGFYEKMPTI